MRRLVAAASAAAAFTLAACGPSLIPPAAAGTFDTFDSCDALLARLRALGAEHVGRYGWVDDTPARDFDTDAAVEDSGASEVPLEAAPAVPAPASPAPAAPGVSGTNVQEASVDEADAVKAAPGRILILDAGTLTYVDVSSGAPVVRGTVEVGGSDLFVSGDRVLVIGSGAGGAEVPSTRSTAVPPTGEETASTELTEVDVADPDKPRVVRTLEADGTVVGSRMHGETVRLVLTSEPRLDFVLPGRTAAGGRAAETNRRIVAESTLEDWLPRTTGADGETRSVDCAGVMVPQTFSGVGMLSVLTLDLARPIEFGATATLVAEGSQIYASPSTLYVSMTGAGRRASSTAIHAFDVSGTEPARYLASGKVDGTLYDQWAMSEQDGVLRVASTSESRRGDRSSSVTVLRREGEALVETGRVDGLGPTEEIKAVRMAGEVGYVVTFRQTDPLYVVDLRDPAHPAVTGELKIPGFSEYLHPVAGGRLLGVGQDADETTGITRGLQVSLFDVSDPAAPRRTATWSAGPASDSAVASDHRAFLFWEATGTVVLPVESYGEVPEVLEPAAGTGAAAPVPDAVAPSPTTTFAVLQTDGDALAEAGRIPAVRDAGWHGPGFQRSVVVGDVLYTIDSAGIGANRLGTLERIGEAHL